MSGTTDVMQRVLSHHLSLVPYQFSIIEDVGIPANSHALGVSLTPAG